ncbi:MAG: hypothetical protein RR795_01415 [Cetobacterium sp.]|uniref:hypothetical protein n=1 Tax=Cetobacterium sp. TaxID=2071632 RepID=UPI002FCA8F06
MYKIEHSSIIDDRSIDVIIKSDEINKENTIVNGKIMSNEKEYEIKMAYFPVNPEETNYQEGGFKKGDLKCYVNLKNSYIPKENDRFLDFYGTEYVIKEKIQMYFLDYKMFIARIAVDSNE